MRGDVLFYTPHSFVERLVAWWTHGPYSHVDVDLGDGQCVSADLGGIDYAPVGNIAARISPPQGANIDAGLRWLRAQVGKKYGTLDIADAIIKGLGIKTFFIARTGRYDCSDLTTRYLTHCGVDLGPLADAPHLVTPNDLARQLGVQ